MFATLVRPAIVVHSGDAAVVDDQLYEEERAHIAKAVESRRAEFGTARLLARKALAELGVAPGPLVPTPNRAPTWPAEVVGSITHCKGWVAVAVARRSDVRSIGIDAEVLRKVDPGVARVVLKPRERMWAGDQLDRLLLIFSAKEAYYKAQFPLTNRVLVFQDVELDVDLDAGRFVVNAPSDLLSAEGRFAFDNGRVLSAVEL